MDRHFLDCGNIVCCGDNSGCSRWCGHPEDTGHQPSDCQYHTEWNSHRIHERLSVIYKAFGVYVFTFLFILFVGQAFSVVFYFTGKTDIYNGIAYYHNIAYNKARIEYKDKTLEEFLNERYQLVNEHYKKVCAERYPDLVGEAFDKQCIAVQKGVNGSMYIDTMNSATRKKYGYYVVAHREIPDEYQDVIKVIDKEWNTYTYYVLDKSNYTVKQTTKKYYDDVNNN